MAQRYYMMEFALNNAKPSIYSIMDDKEIDSNCDSVIDYDTQAVDVSLGPQTVRCLAYRLARTWPFFKELLQEVGAMPFVLYRGTFPERIFETNRG